MLRVSCLIKNTTLQQDLKDLVEYIAYNRLSERKEASIAAIYKDIRKLNVEVDLQTVGAIYNEVLPKNYSDFSSDDDVNTYVLKKYEDSVKRAALLQPDTSEKQIGEDKPELQIVKQILNTFTKTYASSNQIKSDMRKMQDALWDGVKRKLNIPNKQQQPQTEEQWVDILNKALGFETLGIVDVNGKLNSISDLFNRMKEHLQETSNKIEKDGDVSTIDRWNNMVNILESSAYNILLSKGDAEKLFNSIMKDAGFAKKLKNGKTILDWNKLSNELGDIQAIRDNVQNVLEKEHFNQDVIDRLKDSLESEFNELLARTYEYRINELNKRENAIGKEVIKKSDLKRLSELGNLGVFNGTHDRLINNLLGVTDIQAQDFEDLKQLSKAASELYKEIDKNYGNDIYATSALQTLQKHIDSIISRNMDNKTSLNKAVSVTKNFMDIMMTSLLMSPLTITENIYSGGKEILVPIISGKRKFTKQDFEIWSSLLLDASARGQSFGEEVGSFAPRELYSNSLKFDWSTPKKVAESLLNALMYPAKIGLLGFDSANKAIITNKIFQNSIYKALMSKGMNEKEALEFMNTSLYGKSFEDAKDKSKDLLEKVNLNLEDKYKIPINKHTVTRLANDIVKANLNTNGALDNSLIEAALKSSYHVAGYGLGHEPNNYISRGIKGIRDDMMRKEQYLSKMKDWDALAYTRLKNTLANSLLLRFTGGATNWIYLRIQSGLGVGILTGSMGRWGYNDSGFENKSQEEVEKYIKEMQNARNKIARGLVGITISNLSLLMFYILKNSSDDEREKNKKRLEELKLEKQFRKLTAEEDDELSLVEIQSNVFKQIRNNYMLNKSFKKFASDPLLLFYYANTSKNKISGVAEFIGNYSGIMNDFSDAEKFSTAVDLFKKEDTDGGYGALASIVGDRFSVPLWRPYKEWYRLGKSIAGSELSSTYKEPTTFTEGLFGGGALEDLGAFNRDSRITILNGVGIKTYQRFEKKGIKTVSDLKKSKDWEYMTYTDEDTGQEKLILNESSRKKILNSLKKIEQKD